MLEFDHFTHAGRERAELAEGRVSGGLSFEDVYDSLQLQMLQG